MTSLPAPPTSPSPSRLPDPAEIGLDLIPALSQLYHAQAQYSGQFDPEPVKDIFFHAMKYPQQTCYGFLIGKVTANQLHIVEAVPISHTQHVSPALFEGALEITMTRIAKTVDLSAMQELLLGSTTPQQQQSPHFHPQQQSPPPPQHPPSHTAGLTNTSLMDQIEDLMKQDAKQSEASAHNPLAISPIPANAAAPQFSSPELFFSGLYICPAPTPKLNEDVIDVLRRFHTPSTSATDAASNTALPKPTPAEYETARQAYLHATLRSIPHPLLKNVMDLTNVCPSPTLTILDPILLNLLTNAFDQHRLSKTTTPYTPTLPSLLTYFLHDDVIMTPSDELFASNNIHDLLFLDTIAEHPEEAANQPTTTTLSPKLFTTLMADIGNRLHMALIDWQEASGE